MRLLRTLCCLLGLCGLTAMAEVIETPVTLPDDLGSGVLYRNATQTAPTAGVIVVHEWWGLNDYARSRARQLAKAGYTALAVDMYGHGRVADHPDTAEAFMNAALAEPERMNARFDAARAALASRPSVDPERVFAIGYCFGGGVVLNQARRGLPLAGVASFHGSLGTETPAQPGKMIARVLVATGGADPFVPATQVSAFVEEMMAAGADLTLHVYPDAPHSFTNPEADARAAEHGLSLGYDARADRDSWAALLRLLAEE